MEEIRNGKATGGIKVDGPWSIVHSISGISYKVPSGQELQTNSEHNIYLVKIFCVTVYGYGPWTMDHGLYKKARQPEGYLVRLLPAALLQTFSLGTKLAY